MSDFILHDAGIYSYDDLIASLKKDLQLDATTEVAAHTVWQAAKNDGLAVSWGVATTGTGAVLNAGSKDWTASGPTTGELMLNYVTRAVAPAIIATVINGSSEYEAQVLTWGVSSSTIFTYTVVTPTLVNVNVAFAILG